MADLTPHQRDVLIRTALGEARGEGVEGMADVLQVIINRANSGDYPSDPAAVALQKNNKSGIHAFSAWNTERNGGNNPNQFKTTDPIYKKAAEALEAVVSGSRPDYTGGATHYHTAAVNPYWAKSVNKHGTVERNGHIFYPTNPLPPGELPQVGTAQSTTRPPVTGAPTPLPPMLAAQRTIASAGFSEPSADFMASMYPKQRVPSNPITDRNLVFDRGITDTIQNSQAQQYPDLAAQLAAYAAPKAPAPSMRQPSASERSALAYVAPPRVPPAANGRDLQRAEQTQRLQPRVTTVASIPTTPPRAQLPPVPPSRVASPRVISTTMERAAAAVTPQAAPAVAPRHTAQRQPTASERAALAYVAPKPTTVAAAPRQPNASERAALAYVPPPAPVRPVQPVRMNDTGKPLPSFGDFQNAFGPPAIPGPNALPKIGEERLVAGEWGVPAIQGLPRLPGQDMGVGTALSVMPPLPRARPTMQPVQMASVPLPRPRPVQVQQRAPVQQAPQRRPLFALPTPFAQRPAQRAPLNVVVQGAKTQQPVQQVQQPTFNPANHSAAQLEALAAGRSSYTGSDGGMQPVYAMNGKLRNTY